MSFWTRAIALGFIDLPAAQEIIRTTRDAFGLGEPVDRTDVMLNRRVPRETVRAHVVQACAEAEWGDGVLGFFAWAEFHPEQVGDLFRPDAEALGHPLTAKEKLVGHAFADGVTDALRASALPRLFGDALVDLLTDYAISGSLTLPKGLPEWFTGNVFTLPIHEDRTIVLLATRYSDLSDLVARLT